MRLRRMNFTTTITAIDTATLIIIPLVTTHITTVRPEHETPLETKVKQVIKQLEQNKVFIVYSELHESCTIVTKEELDKPD